MSNRRSPAICPNPLSQSSTTTWRAASGGILDRTSKGEALRAINSTRPHWISARNEVVALSRIALALWRAANATCGETPAGTGKSASALQRIRLRFSCPSARHTRASPCPSLVSRTRRSFRLDLAIADSDSFPALGFWNGEVSPSKNEDRIGWERAEAKAASISDWCSVDMVSIGGKASAYLYGPTRSAFLKHVLARVTATAAPRRTEG